MKAYPNLPMSTQQRARWVMFAGAKGAPCAKVELVINAKTAKGAGTGYSASRFY
jgi:hypothetical protein